MFVEKKLNKSGSTSVRVMQKVQGKRKCVKVMGCSSDDEEIGLLVRAKFLAESLYEIEYVNPYNGKKMSVMLRADYDEEVMKLLDAIGLKH